MAKSKNRYKRNSSDSKFKKVLSIIVFVLFLAASLYIYAVDNGYIDGGNKVADVKELTAEVGELPGYEDSPYCTVNGNKADFDEELLDRAARGTFEDYGGLDSHGRCTQATACLSPATMPEEGETRGDISSIHPSGWKSGMLWERCHLIAWMLSAENDNKQNLITGTHTMNVKGMLPFEKEIAEYIDDSGNKVLYQVTPIYEGKNAIASGVHMMAYSVDDKGRGINFNIYCYNVTPNKSINYKTGVVTALDSNGKEVEYEDRGYVINLNSKKFHYPSCSGASSIAENNRKQVNESRTKLINEGYEPCGICQP